MELHKLIEPLGILTYVTLFITVLSGLLKWNFKYHKTLAISALTLATAHMLIVALH